MKKTKIITTIFALTLAFGGSVYAADDLSGLVPMADTAVVEPMANNGNELPLEQGVELDTGSVVEVTGDAPVAEEPVPEVTTQVAPVSSSPAVVELTPVKVEKLPKTGDNPYTSSVTYVSMLVMGAAAIAYLFVSRKKKAQTSN